MGVTAMNEDALARFGLDVIDLRSTIKDIAGKRWMILNLARPIRESAVFWSD
jgi:hypothetical protein